MPGSCKGKMWGDSGPSPLHLPSDLPCIYLPQLSSRAHYVGTPSSCLLSHPLSEAPLAPLVQCGAVLRGQVVQGGHAETSNDSPPALLGQELVPHSLLGFERMLDLGAGQSAMSPGSAFGLIPISSPQWNCPSVPKTKFRPTHMAKEHGGSTNLCPTHRLRAPNPKAPFPDLEFYPSPKIEHQIVPSLCFHSKPRFKRKSPPRLHPQTQARPLLRPEP